MARRVTNRHSISWWVLRIHLLRRMRVRKIFLQLTHFLLATCSSRSLWSQGSHRNKKSKESQTSYPLLELILQFSLPKSRNNSLRWRSKHSLSHWCLAGRVARFNLVPGTAWGSQLAARALILINLASKRVSNKNTYTHLTRWKKLGIAWSISRNSNSFSKKKI